MSACTDGMKLGSTETWSLKSKQGKIYDVSIGFPRDWSKSALTPGQEIPIMYITDGNSVFLTALEALHRRLSIPLPLLPTTIGIIVSIGYPLSPDSSSVFDHSRRRWDLTPAAPGSDAAEGGADEFLDFISDEVRTLAHRRLRETRGAKPGKEALYGHSFGGLFCLHTLFTRPRLFDSFIASSPSIWWNHEFILQEEASFREKHIHDDSRPHKPRLMLTVGGDEQEPPRYRTEPGDGYEERLRRHRELRMVDNVAFRVYIPL